METQVCQVCKERKAFKKVVSNIEGDFFLLCKKKKCSEKLYSDLMKSGTIEQQEYMKKLLWNPSDFQGRSYDKVKRDEKVIMYTFLILVGALFVFAMYSVIKNVF